MDEDREQAHAELEGLRARISDLDDELIRLIGERRELVLAVGRVKQRLGLPVMDPAREAGIVRRAARRARALGVDEEMSRDVIWRIIAAARAEQEDRPEGWPERPAIPEE
jgi:chorismate mutase / prephenate dehydrogenase